MLANPCHRAPCKIWRTLPAQFAGFISRARAAYIGLSCYHFWMSLLAFALHGLLTVASLYGYRDGNSWEVRAADASSSRSLKRTSGNQHALNRSHHSDRTKLRWVMFSPRQRRRPLDGAAAEESSKLTEIFPSIETRSLARRTQRGLNHDHHNRRSRRRPRAGRSAKPPTPPIRPRCICCRAR